MGSCSRGRRSVVLALAFLFAGAAAAQAQSISLASGKTFHKGDTTVGATTCPDITITCGGGYWNTASGIRLIIPASVNLTWDTSVTNPVYDKTNINTGNVGAVVSYPTSKVCLVPVTSNFIFGPPASSVVIKNLRFIVGSPLPTNFGSLGAAYDGTNTPNLSDVNSLTILNNPSISSGGSYAVNPPGPVAANTITITEANSSPGIQAASDLRITIPASLNMTWNSGITAPTFGGTASGRVFGTVSYANGNRTLVVNVTSDFLSNQTLTIAGLQFTGIGTDSSGQLIVTTNSNANPLAFPNDTNATDSSTITVLGLPTISSAANQAFTKGDPATLALAITVTESAGTPKITAANGIRLIIPAGFNMTWDTSIVSATVSGTGQGAGHIAAAPAVTYANGNRTAVIPVLSTFGSSQTAVISGLRFANFSNASAPNNLQLDTTNDGVPEDTDNRTIAIGAPTISSGSLQVFQVGDPVTNANAITITDGNPARITSAGSIRLKIPAGFNMIWDTSIVSATVTGTAQGAGHIAAAPAVTYEDANQTAVIPVLSTFGAAQTAVISGLRFTNFTAPSTPNSLQLEVNNLGTNCNVDAFNIAIGGIPSISSQSNQAFTVNDPATAAVQITITDANGFPFITAANDLRITIPAGLPMTWNTAIVNGPPLVFGGTGSGHVAAGNPKVSYSIDNKTAIIAIASDFTVGQTLTVTGLQFQNFTAAANPASLLLFVDPLGSGVPDDKTLAIGRPGIALSASQTFGVGDPSTTMNTVTVTEDATVARISSANGIRLIIPAGLSMTWDATVTSATVTGTAQAAGHIASVPTVTYANGNKTAVIPVLSTFGVGQTAILAGLKVTSFGSASGPLPLSLDVSGLSTVCSTSTQTISIGDRPQLLSVVTADTNGNGSIDHLILTYDKPLNTTTTSVTAGLGFSIVAPNYTIGAGSGSGAVVTLTLVEKGNPDTGATPSVVYDPMVGNLQDLSGLTTNSTGPVVAKDGAAPVATGITRVDGNGNGHLDSVTISFSENLLAGQEDVGDWRLIDANGTTDLLQGLGSIVISGNTVQFNLADSSGTTGTPAYLYAPDLNLLQIQDTAIPPNVALQQTNASVPLIQVNPDFAVGPSKVQLDASRSTDPNGQPLTFSWTNGSPFTLFNPDTATPYFLGTTAGTYTFTVTVSNLLVSVSKDVIVTILNVPPGADAGSNQTVSPTQFPVHVVALASTDANGDAVTFNWIQISGAPVVLGGPTLPYPAFTAPTPSAVFPPDNILTFEVTVSDGTNSTKSRAQVRVNAVGNLAPTADAGRDQVAIVGSTVQLDGSLSRDPEGLPLGYQWTSTTPLNPMAGNIVNPTFVPTLPGLYTFTLSVTDAANLASFPSTVRVLVQAANNQAPVAVAHRFQPIGEIVVGDEVVLDATGSKDPEGLPVTYAWLQVAGPQVILENPSGIRPTFTPVRAATYTFRLTVSDGVNQSNPVLVSLTVKDLPGDVTFTTTLTPGLNVGPSNHATLPVSFQLDVATSDPGNTWYFYLEQTSGPAAAINSSSGLGDLAFPPTNLYSVTPTVPGLYTFKLASTSYSLIRAYATVSIVVDGPAAYVVPTAVAAAPLTAIAGQLLTLDAGGSAGATRYYWTQLEGPPVALSDPKAQAPTLTPLAAGQYTFQLTVADATTSSAPSFVVVTVSAAPVTSTSSGSSGGCGSLGLDGILLLGLIGLGTALRSRLTPKRIR